MRVPTPNYLSSFQLRTQPTAFQRQLMKLVAREPRSLHQATAELQRTLLRLAIRNNTDRGTVNLSAVARELRVQRHTLYRLLRRS